ncbi:hypothetical protein GGH12_005854 [Coemansia sp. RSA 1822]|nr:hypothetical protein LPJ76_005461 [Coemansia sp. RSA 638]KAJ2558443.1 hypothetical protein GGH12_005854 [Coemansia sp. RSA 1822]
MFSDRPMYTVPNNILNTKSEQRIRMMSGIIRNKDGWVSDGLIDDDTTLELKRYVAVMEDSPAAAADPNTFGQFPGSYTQWVEDIEKIWKDDSGKGIFYFSPAGPRLFMSEKFCRLPTEFRVDDDGTVTIESYINNLNPVKHASFYPTIACIFSKFVPILEHILTDVLFPCSYRVRPNAEYWFKTEENEPEFDDAYYQFDDDYWAWREH